MFTPNKRREGNGGLEEKGADANDSIASRQSLSLRNKKGGKPTAPPHRYLVYLLPLCVLLLLLHLSTEAGWMSSGSNAAGGSTGPVGGMVPPSETVEANEALANQLAEADARRKEMEDEISSLKARLSELKDETAELSKKAASKDASDAKVATPKAADCDTKQAGSTAKDSKSRDLAGSGPVGSGRPSTAKTTWYKCHERGAWSDLCHYENVCWNAFGKLVFVVDELPDHPVESIIRGVGMKMATKLPEHEPAPDRKYPTHYHVSEISYITPDELDMRSDVMWTKSSNEEGKGAYLVSYQDRLSNIWYYSTRVLPLFTAEHDRESLRLPEIGEVIFPIEHTKISSDWHHGLLSLALPNDDIPVYYGKDEPYLGMERKDKLICSKQAVLLGANVYGFTDMITAHKFKVKAYAYAGLPPPPIQPPHDASTVPKNITVLDRARKAPRHITNIQPVLEVVRKYGYEPNWLVLSETVTFKEQIRLMASTGVLVTVHGAGMLNQIFMPPGAVAIEIFPNHAKHVLYERVAHYAGIYHFKLYTTEHPKDMKEKHIDYFDLKCDDMLGLELPAYPQCWGIVKNIVVVVPLREFEVTLAHALDFFTRTKVLLDTKNP